MANATAFGRKHNINPKQHFMIKGNIPTSYDLKYIPHKVLIDQNGVVVKNGSGKIGIEDAIPLLLVK